MTDSRSDDRENPFRGTRAPSFAFQPDRLSPGEMAENHGFWMRLDVQVSVACAVSCMLSLLAWSVSDGINPDGILYVEVAQAYATDGFSAAMAMYDWPFFSALIGSWAQLSGSSFLLSAQLLSGLMLAGFCGGFVALCREVYSDPRVGWGGLLIVSSMLGLNEYRDYVIRDFGFWALIMAGTLALCRAIKAPSWRNLLTWQLCVALALCFRIEAIIFAVLAPLVLLVSGLQWKLKLRSYIECNVLLLLAVAGSYLYLGNAGIAELVDSSKLKNVLQYASLDRMDTRVANFRGRWFEEDAAQTILLAGLLGLLLIKTAAKVGIANLALGILAIRSPAGTLRGSGARRVIIWMVIIGLALPYYVLLYKPVLQGRWVILSAIFLLVLISGVSSWLLDSFAERKTTIVLLGVLFCGTLADAFIQTGNSKQHLIDAAVWVKNEYPAHRKLLTNHHMLDFYSGREVFERGHRQRAKARFFEQRLKNLAKFDLLMIREKGQSIPEVVALETAGRIRRIQQFEGPKEGRVVNVYEVVRSKADNGLTRQQLRPVRQRFNPA